MSGLDLDALTAVARAATPGPWEYGNRWHVAGVMPDKFGKGRCVYCEKHDEPTWRGPLDINGEKMPAHVHTSEEAWYEHGMYALRDDGPVLVINDTDEYGYLEPADAEYVATFDPPTVLALIARIRLLQDAIAIRDAQPDEWEL